MVFGVPALGQKPGHERAEGREQRAESREEEKDGTKWKWARPMEKRLTGFQFEVAIGNNDIVAEC